MFTSQLALANVRTGANAWLEPILKDLNRPVMFEVGDVNGNLP